MVIHKQDFFGIDVPVQGVEIGQSGLLESKSQCFSWVTSMRHQ